MNLTNSIIFFLETRSRQTLDFEENLGDGLGKDADDTEIHGVAENCEGGGPQVENNKQWSQRWQCPKRKKP